MEPLLSCNKARVVMAALKGLKKIDHGTLCRLVTKEGLPKHQDPFGSGHWCFLESEIHAWAQARLNGDPKAKPFPGPGRRAKAKD